MAAGMPARFISWTGLQLEVNTNREGKMKMRDIAMSTLLARCGWLDWFHAWGPQSQAWRWRAI